MWLNLICHFTQNPLKRILWFIKLINKSQLLFIHLKMHPVLFGSLSKVQHMKSWIIAGNLTITKLDKRSAHVQQKNRLQPWEENYLHLYCPKISDLSLIFCPYQWASLFPVGLGFNSVLHQWKGIHSAYLLLDLFNEVLLVRQRLHIQTLGRQNMMKDPWF